MTTIKAVRQFATQIINTDGLEIGTPVVTDEITFVPIIKQVLPKEERDYLTLSEAIEEKVCKIIDKGTEVAHIVFHNLGKIPILIEEGEIFLGDGTQDRICVGTIMVPPGESMEIPVKCVHAPHHLSSGAAFGYGGKCSRGMLRNLRAMKMGHAVHKAPVSTISQHDVWDTVASENLSEVEAKDKAQYTQAVRARSKRAKKRSAKIKLPPNTIGLIVVDADGNIKGVEIHRSPRNFAMRKDGILESLEATISWEKTGKGPYKNATEPVKKLFNDLSSVKEEEAMNQVEVDGLVLNVAGVTGECLSSEFYSAVCPECGQAKPRKKSCPSCGADEEATEEMTFFSMA